MARKSRRRTTASQTGAPPRPRRPAARTGGTTAVERERLNALQQAVEAVAPQLHRDRVLKPGTIVFRASAADTDGFALRGTETSVHVESGGDHSEPLLEVIGDPRRIQSILRGTKDARIQFFAGGIRVRGDIQYLSDLGMKLGNLKKPIF